MSGISRPRLGAMVLTVALAVTGCNGGDSAMPTDPGAVEGSVTFWTYPIGDSGKDSYWDPVVEQFRQKYPKVKIDVVVQPFTNREETLVTAIAGKQGPDVVYFNPDFIPKFAVEGVLEPVEDVIADDRDDFTPAALDAMSWDGKLYGVPLLMQALIGVCNKKVLAASGVQKCPETWADIEQMAPKVKAAGYVPTDYVAAQTLTLNHSFYPYLWQAGGEVLTADGKKAAFNSPEGLRALEFVKKLVDNGWTSQQSLTTAETLEQSALGQGRQAYSPNNTTVGLSKLFKPEELVVSPPLTDKVQVAAGSVGGLSVLADSDAKAASKAWVDFLTSPEHMRSFDQKNGYYAPRKSVTGLYSDNPGMAEGEKHLAVIRSGVIHPKAREIMNLIKPHLQAVLLGKTAPKDALAAAEKDVNALLERR